MLFALSLLLGMTLCGQVRSVDISLAAVEAFNAIASIPSLEVNDESLVLSGGIGDLGNPRFKRQLQISRQMCSIKLQSCQAILLSVMETSDPAVDMQAACKASLESFTCLDDAIAQCPLPPTIQSNMRTTLGQIVEGFRAHCKDPKVILEYADPANLECVVNTALPIRMCTSLYTVKLFAMTGSESNAEFCCEHLKFLQCIDNRALGLCTRSAKSVLMNHVKTMFSGVTQARSTDDCVSVKDTQCDSGMKRLF